MVAKITSPHDIKRALNYNEQKVQKDQAECIYAGNFLKDADKMNFHEKLDRFRDLISLNDRTQKTNTLHISLNFDPSEKMDKEKLAAIAAFYMEKIGFGDQPYLVYQHNDAGHPHVHILTTTIKEDGERINTYNIGRNQSEKARKEIEQEFNLVKATGKGQRQSAFHESVNAQKVKYGKSETKRAITNVLDAVINQYKYTSLAELNAVLKQYNVVADRGREDGRIYKTGGLFYRILDENGNKVGVPVKASSIYSKPTLKNLEEKFAENEIKRKPDKQKLKTAIDFELSKNPRSLQEFILALQKQKIQVVLRQNSNGLIYGITFVDLRTKAVFNGSDLGKQYSASTIQQKTSPPPPAQQPPVSKSKGTPQQTVGQNMEIKEEKIKEHSNTTPTKNNDLINLLMKSERNEGRIPSQLLQKKRKKKRKLGL